mgnify:CR=1 FL=1
MNNKFNCGIDVSKKKLDVVLLKEEKYLIQAYPLTNHSKKSIDIFADNIL